MADTLKVRAVEGRLCSYEGPRVGYVGWSAADDSEHAEHVIPDVVRLKRSVEAVDVPNTVYYRRALACGDLEAADEVEESTEEAPLPNALRSAQSEV